MPNENENEKYYRKRLERDAFFESRKEKQPFSTLRQVHPVPAGDGTAADWTQRQLFCTFRTGTDMVAGEQVDFFRGVFADSAKLDVGRGGHLLRATLHCNENFAVFKIGSGNSQTEEVTF